MKIEPRNDKDDVRDLDPDVRQRRASRPDYSVWVNASAGTGKTKVLTDRVLRLLLPVSKDRPGTPPHKILCLTFTKAAASEMALRVHKILGLWAVMPETELHAALKKLFGRPAHAHEVGAARQLFAHVVDSARGLQIMTIHSFCQSVLSRFPLEAGLAPNMTVLDDIQSRQLLQQAQSDILDQAQSAADSALQDAFAHIALVLNEDRFASLLQAMTGERRQLESLMRRFPGENGLYTAVCRALEIEPGLSAQDIEREFCAKTDEPALRRACAILANHGGAAEQKRSLPMQFWLDADISARAAALENYGSLFLTQKNEPLKKLVNKTIQDNFPDIADILNTEALRLLDFRERLRRVRCAAFTRDLLKIGVAIMARYQSLKIAAGGLDYDDLIFRTLDLFEGRTMTPRLENMSAWILYKLDRGIDHILIDEAQDTNPEQWEIIARLTEEFHAGENAHDQPRSIFTVGDHKQSIYSFQRASPEEFARNHQNFRQSFAAARQNWDDVDLNISFRSVKTVLAAVDAAFASPDARQGLGAHDIVHHSYRIGQAGLVELWPLAEAEKSPPRDAWDPPVRIIEKTDSGAALADSIAVKIKNWIDTGEELPARGRAIRPGDIMILVRSRNAFTEQLFRALKNRGLPVGGADRMILNAHIAVQDLLAFAESALSPEDDLSLACILKSPLIGLSEEQLYALAYARPGTLWQAVLHSVHTHITAYLQDLQARAVSAPPFDFFNRLLQHPCPACATSGLRAMKTRLGEDAQDPLDEFLSEALAFETLHPATLQNFLQRQKRNQTEIKRDPETRADSIRIMTIHGAKGLQAPVVILPDTIRSVAANAGRAEARLLWPNRTGFSVPLWSPLKDMDPALFTQGAQIIDARMEEEYKRLLYVAMTRAEDRLYIAGYTTLKPPRQNSWYFMVRDAIAALPDTRQLEDGVLRLKHPQSDGRPPDRAEIFAASKNEKTALPDWLFEKAAAERDEVLHLAPSQTDAAEPLLYSPLQKSHEYRFRRGNLTHKLLEILPGLPLETRARAAGDFIRIYGRDLPPDLQSQIVEETLRVLDHAEFSAVFGPGSLSEVPVTGHVEGRLVSGQIDRLLVTDAAIYIIDYKTNRPPPLDPAAIPPLYMRQMRIYADIIASIYPGRTVRAALLWTDGPILMPVDFN